MNFKVIDKSAQRGASLAFYNKAIARCPSIPTKGKKARKTVFSSFPFESWTVMQ